jgi:ketosteroid isomerase-like protein
MPPCRAAVLALLATLTTPFAVGANGGPPSCGGAGPAIAAASEQWETAFRSRDAAGVAAVYSAAAQLFPPNGEIVSGREAITRYYQGAFDAGVAEIRLRGEPPESSGDLAYRTTFFTVVGRDGAVLDEGKAVEVWRCLDGRWQFHRDIWNSLRPERPPAG